jgi:tetratricopeptide (TPR) repeat protein
MPENYKEIIEANQQLSCMTTEQQYHLPYKALAEKLRKFNFLKLTAVQKEALTKHKSINIAADIWVDVENKNVETSKCKNLLVLMDIMSADKSSSKTQCQWQTIRDFWYRVKSSGYAGNHSSVAIVLDPLAVVCGYSNFRDFVESEFRVARKKFSILVLPFTGDILQRKDAEILLVKRYAALSEKENLPLEVAYEPVPAAEYFTHRTARKIGESKNADLLIFGDLYLRNNNKPEINIQYALVKPNPLTGANNWSSNTKPFSFSELSDGHLPAHIDYIVYWSLGIQAYQYNEYPAALKYFEKIVQVLQMEDDEVCYRMAVIYTRLRQEDVAVEYYKKTIGHNSRHCNALLNLGIYFFINNNALEAKKYLEKFLQTFTDPVDNTLYEIGRTYLGVSLKSLGEIELAETYLSKATAYAQQNPQLVNYAEVWGRAYFELGEIYLEAATEHQEEDSYSKAKTFYYHAAKWSKDEELHEKIAYYFNTYGEIREAYQVVKSVHSLDDTVLKWYKGYVDRMREKER